VPALNKYNRGYERLRAQNFEKRTSGDLKEGFYFGPNLSENHPDVVAQKFNLGPNTYPHEVKDPIHFRNVIDDYISRMLSLARNIVGILCQTLDVTDSWVPTFFDDPIAVLRLLHHPPQPADASEDERGESPSIRPCL
jgi:isopenicillin N synthase-like dioxygenase